MSDKNFFYLMILFFWGFILWFGVVQIPAMQINYHKDIDKTQRIYQENWTRTYNEVAYLLRCNGN